MGRDGKQCVCHGGILRVFLRMSDGESWSVQAPIVVNCLWDHRIALDAQLGIPPVHAWVYRLDGTLAKASGVGAPAGFDVGDFALKPVAVACWRRTVWIPRTPPWPC